MAWTHRDTQNSGYQASGTTITVTKPTGLTVGDIMVAALMSVSSNRSWTPPTDWLSLWTQTDVAMSFRGYYKVATADDVAASNFTFTISSSAPQIAAITAFYESGTPTLEVANSAATAGTSHATPSIAPAQSNLLMVAAFALDATGTTANAWSGYSTGYEERVDVSNPGGSASLAIATKVEAAGGTFSCTATSSISDDGRAAIAAFYVTGAGGATGHTRLPLMGVG